eukprot:s3764_g3.t6
MALALIFEMSQIHVERDIVTYSAGISACEKGLQWQRAVGLFAELLQSAQLPDIMAFNAAINACKKEDRWCEATQLASLMKEMGLEPDVNTFIALAASMERTGQWQQILCLVKEQGELKQDLMIQRLVSLASGGLWELSLHWLVTMEASQQDPGAHVRAAAIEGSSVEHRHSQALQLLEAMSQSCVTSLAGADTLRS